MKKFILLMMIAAAVSCGKTTVSWKEGEPVDKRYSMFTLEIQQPPAGTDWYIWFSQFRTPVTLPDEADGRIEHVSGTLYRFIPTVDTHGKPLQVTYQAKTLPNHGRAPEAFYLVKPGKKPVKLEVAYEFLPSELKHSFEWEHVDVVPVEAIIPRLKRVQKEEGETAVPEAWTSSSKAEGQVPGWYRITLKDNTATVEAADDDALYWAGVTLANLRESADGAPVPPMVIEDWPDLPFRGLMLDVSRNFTTKDNLLTLIDLMARYKANVLHLHMGDDEGWRVEIDALPELTSYGAFRGLPVLNEDGSISEPDALQPTYSASLDRNDLSGTANGYYSHADFVEILRYAAERHIKVIPEFDTPGHSRAAIKSMEKRAELTETPPASSRSRPIPPATCLYRTIRTMPSMWPLNLPTSSLRQCSTALSPSTGKPVPLDVIHVGGDEVPDGAWIGSPACQKLMQKNGWRSVERLKDYYVSRVLDIAAAKGVKIAGWQELVQHLQPETAAKLAQGLGYTNVWTVSRGREELPYQFANQGIPVVISSAPNAYLDFAYNDSKLERGHNWGGLVDERRTFSLLPYSMYRSVRWDDHGNMRDISHAPDGKTPLVARENIVGVQGQLWTETIRSFDHVTYYIFPKALGLFERGWNASPAWEGTEVSDDPAFVRDFNAFYSIIYDKELPYYQEKGIAYHIN